MPHIIKMPKRFDYSASEEFNTKVNAGLHAEAQAIILDFFNMDYIDSAGIGLLVMAHKKTLGSSSAISIIHCKPVLKEVLLLANLQKLIDIK